MSLHYSNHPSRVEALRARRRGASELSNTRAIRIIGAFFATTVFFTPFDAVLNVALLGELAHESYAIINVACAPLVLFLLLTNRVLRVPRSLLVILLLIVLTIFASFAANLTTVLGAETKGRHGLEKLLTSSLVPIFGMYIALLAYNVTSWNFRRWVLLPLFASAIVVIAVGTFELASSYVGALREPYDRLFLLTHAGFDRFESMMGALDAASSEGAIRISSILFEPADFGTYLIYVAPWLLASFLSPVIARSSKIPRFWRACLYLSMLGMAVVLAVFSGRTAALGLPAILAIFVLLCLMTRLSYYPKASGVVSWLITIGAVVAYLAPIWLISVFTSQVVSSTLASGSTSNVSRLGTIVILLDLFRDNPIFGVGLGQYGFYVARYVPSWAYTFEFRRWLGDLTGSFFPTFSVFARLAGEMGIVGLVTWVGFLGYLLRKVTLSAHAYYGATREFPFFGIALMTNFFSLGLTGLGMASLRVFWIWVLLGCAACYALNPFTLDPQRLPK